MVGQRRKRKKPGYTSALAHESGLSVTCLWQDRKVPFFCEAYPPASGEADLVPGLPMTAGLFLIFLLEDLLELLHPADPPLAEVDFDGAGELGLHQSFQHIMQFVQLVHVFLAHGLGIRLGSLALIARGIPRIAPDDEMQNTPLLFQLHHSFLKSSAQEIFFG
jgi:hypothetical protein